MHLRKNIDHFNATPGVIATIVHDSSGPDDFRGDENWREFLRVSQTLLEKSQERTIRVVVGHHTVVLQTEGVETIGVVLPTGHALAKSLRRMIRRMSRRQRSGFLRAATPTNSGPNGPASSVDPVVPTQL
jgi:hypothetical protein